MDLWEAGSDINDIVHKLVAEFHPHLALIVDDIAVVFREKATKKGGVIIPGKVKKAPSLLEVLGKRNYAFILEVGWDEWGGYSDKQRVALIDHLLCGCQSKVDEKGGGMKYFIAPPDFAFYKEEIRRHGIWQDIGSEDDKDQAATTIEERFIKEKESEEKESDVDDEEETDENLELAEDALSP